MSAVRTQIPGNVAVSKIFVDYKNNNNNINKKIVMAATQKSPLILSIFFVKVTSRVSLWVKP